MTDDRSWTDAERRALRDLGRPAPPPDGLEDRIVAAAARAGLVRRRGAPRAASVRWPRVALAAAAGLALLLAGGWLGSRLAAPPAPEGPRYLLLLHEGPGFDASGDVAGEYAAWAARMRETGGALVGAELSPEARIAEAPGVAGGGPASGRPTGYFILEARDLGEAEEIARSHPHVRRGGTIEVRPIVER